MSRHRFALLRCGRLAVQCHAGHRGGAHRHLEPERHRLRELGFNRVGIGLAVAPEVHRHVRMPQAGVVPRGREAGRDAQFARERVGFHAEQSLDQRTRGDAAAVGKVTLRLAAVDVEVVHRADVAGADAHEHRGEQRALHQPVGLVGAPRLPVAERRVVDLAHHDVVDRPGVRHPVGRREHMVVVVRGHAGSAHRQVRDPSVDIHRHPPCLRRCRQSGIHRVVERPQTRAGMHELQSEQILELGEHAAVREPEVFAHGAGDEFGLMLIRRGILPQQPCEPCRHEIVPVIIGRGVRHAAAMVLQVVAGPDRRVGLVERQLFRTELAPEQPPLPRQVPLDHRPHLPRKLEVARPQQVAEQRVDVDEIHVVVAVRDVAVAVQRRLAAREVGVLVGRRELRRDRLVVLLRRPRGEVPPRPGVPAERVRRIRPAPAEQFRAPGDRAVHHRALRFVPYGVNRHVERGDGGVKIGVGRVDRHLAAQRGEMGLRLREHRRQFFVPVGGSQRDHRRPAADARAFGGDRAIGVEFLRRHGLASGHALQCEEQRRLVGERHAPGHDRQRRCFSRRGEQAGA